MRDMMYKDKKRPWLQLTESFDVALSWFIRSGIVAPRIMRVVKAMDAHLEGLHYALENIKPQ